MRFAYVILASLRESLEFFIIREVGVYRYKSYEIVLKDSTIML
jgi:hypothetical protein